MMTSPDKEKKKPASQKDEVPSDQLSPHQGGAGVTMQGEIAFRAIIERVS